MLYTSKHVTAWLSAIICQRTKKLFTPSFPHIFVNLQKTIKDMRKLSIVLLLIGISIMTMEANNSTKGSGKRLVFKKWHQHKRTPISIPIEATLSEDSIEIRFLLEVDNQVIFQVKDQYGNIILQDIVIPNGQETYKIDLNGFAVGPYEFLYIEENIILMSDIEIEQPIP